MTSSWQQKNRLGIAILVGLLLLVTACGLAIDAETRTERARVAMEDGRYREAVIELKTVLQTEPENALVRLMLAEASFGMGDLLTAEIEADKAAELGADSARTARMQYKVLFASNKYADVLVRLAVPDDRLPESARLELKGEALLRLGSLDAAGETYLRLLELEPDNVEAALGLARVEGLRGNLEEALTRLQELARIHSEDYRVWVQTGLVHREIGQLPEARANLQKGLDQIDVQTQFFPFVTTLVSLSQVQLAQGDLAAARISNEQLGKLVPGVEIYHLMTAKILLAEGETANAMDSLYSVLKSNPSHLEAQFLLGAAKLATGNMAQAEDLLEKVVLQAPENVTARKLLAQTRLSMSRPAAAVEALQPVLSREDGDSMSLALAARASMQTGSPSEAVGYLEQALKASPEDYRLRLELSGAYLANRQSGSARKVLEPVPSDENIAGRRSVLLAMIDGAEGDRDSALIELNRLVAGGSLDEAAMALAGSLYVGLGDLEQARLTLGSVLDQHPENVGVRLALARVDFAEGKLDAATAQLEKVLVLDSGNLVAVTGLAGLSIRRNDPAGAVSYMVKAAELAPESISVQLALVRLHTGLRQFKEAEQAARRAEEHNPGNPQLVNARGVAQLMAGRTEEAISTFRAAIARDEGSAESWLNLSNAQMTSGDIDAARRSLDQVMALRPDWPQALTSMALLALQAGDPDEALKLAEKVIRLAPDASAGYLLAGDILYRNGHFGEAEKRYSAAGERGAGQAAVLRQAMALQRSDIGSADEPLTKWLDAHPDDYSARRALAQVRQVQGDSLAAIHEYEVLEKLNLPDPVSKNNLAWLYFEAGDVRAEGLARSAYKLAPENSSIADTLGWILLNNGDVKEALNLLRDAHERSPDNPEVTYHYAAALARNGDAAGAAELLNALLASGQTFASRDDAVGLMQELK